MLTLRCARLAFVPWRCRAVYEFGYGCTVFSRVEKANTGESQMTVTLPYPPTVNHLYSTIRGRRVLSSEGREFKARAGWMAVAQGMKPVGGTVTLTVNVYRPRRAGDLDNVLKAIQDSLKGIAWDDDSQVVAIHAYRFDDPKNPRVEVEISNTETGEEEGRAG